MWRARMYTESGADRTQIDVPLEPCAAGDQRYRRSLDWERDEIVVLFPLENVNRLVRDENISPKARSRLVRDEDRTDRREAILLAAEWHRGERTPEYQRARRETVVEIEMRMRRCRSCECGGEIHDARPYTHSLRGSRTNLQGEWADRSEDHHRVGGRGVDHRRARGRQLLPKKARAVELAPRHLLAERLSNAAADSRNDDSPVALTLQQRSRTCHGRADQRIRDDVRSTLLRGSLRADACDDGELGAKRECGGREADAAAAASPVGVDCRERQPPPAERHCAASALSRACWSCALEC